MDDALSVREIKVLRQVAARKSDKRIAAERSMIESTVKAPMENVLLKA